VAADRGRVVRLRAAEPDAGERVDRFLARHLPDRSRTEIARWIRAGAVTLDGHPARAAHRLQAGEEVEVAQPPPQEIALVPQPMELEVLYEDDHLLALNKPAGLVVHPGAGVKDGTLVHALLARGERWSTIGGEVRPGIVHRLDRHTSGVMVVARTDAAHRGLAVQFRDRLVEKSYSALVFGRPDPPRGLIDAPIGRHRVHRARMAVRDRGRPAQTRYRVHEDLGMLTLLTALPLTGRTHQIRVHLAGLGHPIVGDRLYGADARLRRLDPAAARAVAAFPRLALHAAGLRLTHPVTGVALAFEAPLPRDLRDLLTALREIGR
jgi:23S rRNA pseudouridine1911/1915/1917 synthase